MHGSGRCHGYQHAEIYSAEMVFYLPEKQGGAEQEQPWILSAGGESAEPTQLSTRACARVRVRLSFILERACAECVLCCGSVLESAETGSTNTNMQHAEGRQQQGISIYSPNGGGCGTSTCMWGYK